MFVSIVSLFLAMAAPGQLLSNPEAQAKLREAQEAFAAEDFDAAAAAVESAYFIEPKPMLLYPWAQAERSRGDCAAAVELYRRFLASDPAAELATVATENMERCQEQLDEAAAEDDDEVVAIIDDDDDTEDEIVEEDPIEEAPQPQPVAAPTEEDNPPKAKAWYLDPVGGALAGVGLVGVGAGVGLLAVASSKAKGASDQDSHTGYRGEVDGATSLRNGGAAALSIGAALLVGGAVRYALVARKNKAAAQAWNVTPHLQRRWVGVSIGRSF